eukprot:TRINITY_DN9142_c0_g1_i1.p1 TRINITY_DN9142_c0_g1~~TRINITY_DN9142_c0_g1_i1.p1  ORF type:complete len:280 (+),score=61.00 TRINITY_DN9142_c0_g1_i1:219-1058(+)
MKSFQSFNNNMIGDFEYGINEHTQFEKEGYCFVLNFLSETGLEFLRERVDWLWNHLGKDWHEEEKEWLMNLHQQLPDDDNWLWDLATHPKLLSILRQHLGENIILYSSQIFVKPPEGGHLVPWHQDGTTLRTVWITLDAVDKNNGGLRVKPGWHKKGRFAMRRCVEYPSSQLPEIDLDVLGLSKEEFEKDVVEYSLNPGCAAFHHPQLPHSSLPNTSLGSRRVIILRYQALCYQDSYEGISHAHWKTHRFFEKKAFLVCGEDPEGKYQCRPTERDLVYM